MNLKRLEELIKSKGRLRVSHNESGSGMGYYWCATLGDEWPYCSSGTLIGAIEDLISEHNRLEKEALQKRINEIEQLSQL
jgi:hypothetical protein